MLTSESREGVKITERRIQATVTFSQLRHQRNNIQIYQKIGQQFRFLIDNSQRWLFRW